MHLLERNFMKRLISPGRLAFLIVTMVVLLALYLTTLYKLQIVEGDKNYEASTNSIVTTEPVIAARGNILDRYGRLLVSNRNCNNLVIDSDELFDQDDPNAVILELCNTVTANGDTYIDELPITMTAPFEYVANMTDLQKTRLNAWLKANGLDTDATAVEVMAKMRSRYDIDANYTAEQMRIIAGIRYEINIRYIINTSDYVFAQDVSINTITALMEANVPGFNVQVSYIREYNTQYAANILGYTGLMNESEYETYGALGYPMDATVCKDGAELAFEKYLHGTDGKAAVTRTSTGVVTNTTYTKEPEPGDHVYLTIDIELQAVAESALSTFIEDLNAQRQVDNQTAASQGKQTVPLVTGGAVVAVDVKTGEPLCMASYPTYNLATLSEDYSELAADTDAPLFNRCLLGAYAPGSTFKPCIALAGLCEGVIGVDTPYTCTGQFTKYADDGYAPYCWLKSGHGQENVVQALTHSCNSFFWNLGDLLKIDRIDKYAAALGLGEATGIELPENAGHVSSPAYKASTQSGQDAQWYAADTLLTAVGQSITGVTPLQIARYIAAIANSGTVYNCSILKSVSSYDYSQSVYEHTSDVYNQINADSSIWDAIHTGMYGVANSPSGTAYKVFGSFTPKVAAKTGTVQTGTTANDAVFVCYAPYDDPQIAVAVVVEKGGSGANVAEIAKQVLQYYFYFEQSTQQIESELTLLQ